MNVVFLTSGQRHHAYIASSVHARFPLRALFLETDHVVPPFSVNHAFERERDAFEAVRLPHSSPEDLQCLIDTYTYASLNEPACIQQLLDIKPEVIIVVGTQRLQAPVFEAASRACLNLHGGFPERYRGLDSHLWAIYHDDFDSLVTTLHYVDATLDTGAIVSQERLRLRYGMGLHHLRTINAEACAKLVLLALTSLSTLNWLPSRRQMGRGRYYSFMPSNLKDVCVEKFSRHTAALPVS